MRYNFGPLLIILAATSWSFDGMLRRALSLPALTIVCYEHLLGLLILLPLLYRNRHECRGLASKDWLALCWVALMGGLVGTWCYTQALAQVKYISFSVVVLLQQLQPIFAILLAWAFLKEKITKSFIAWAAVAIGGAYLISFPELRVNLHQDRGALWAALLALTAAFAWGSSTVFSKHILLKLSAVTAAGLRFLLTFICICPFLWGTTGQALPPQALTWQQWAILMTMTLTVGMVALLIYYRGLKQVEAKVSTICEMFWPLSATLIDIFWYRATFSSTQVIGSFLLLTAIYQVATVKLLAKNGSEPQP